MRSLDAVVGTAVAGTDGGRYPFWSPDSRRWLFRESSLKRIDG